MSLLDSLINMRQQQEAQANADAAAIPAAVNAFITGKQQAKKDLIDEMTIKATLASKGFGANFDTGEIYRDQSLVDPMQQLITQSKNLKAQNDIEQILGAQNNVPVNEGFVRLPNGKTMKDPTYKRAVTPDERNAKLEDDIARKELTGQAGLLPKLDQALGSVQQLKELYYKGANPTDDPAAARLGGLLKTPAAKLGYNPELKQYLQNREGFAGLIAKGGFGEAGMLTQQDIDRVTKLLPDQGSTKKEADLAFKEVEKILGSARQRFEKTRQQYLGGEQSKSSEMPTSKEAISAFKTGDERMMNGKTYVRGDNGQWRPKAA